MRVERIVRLISGSMVTPEERDLVKHGRHQRTWVRMKVRNVGVRVWDFMLLFSLLYAFRLGESKSKLTATKGARKNKISRCFVVSWCHLCRTPPRYRIWIGLAQQRLRPCLRPLAKMGLSQDRVQVSFPRWGSCYRSSWSSSWGMSCGDVPVIFLLNFNGDVFHPAVF